MSVVLLDLDHFKSVNTRFGHLGGDQALAQVAEALMSFRHRTDLVARWGGDELVWLMPGCPRAAAASPTRPEALIWATMEASMRLIAAPSSSE